MDAGSGSTMTARKRTLHVPWRRDTPVTAGHGAIHAGSRLAAATNRPIPNGTAEGVPGLNRVASTDNPAGLPLTRRSYDPRLYDAGVAGKRDGATRRAGISTRRISHGESLTPPASIPSWAAYLGQKTDEPHQRIADARFWLTR